jgi:hypothetical protein
MAALVGAGVLEYQIHPLRFKEDLEADRIF